MSRPPTSATRRWSVQSSKRASSTPSRKRRSSKTKPEPVALALGGNVPGLSGSVEQTVIHALRQLQTAFGDLRVASLYRSAPVSSIPQPDYLNTVVLASTAMPPEDVLAFAKALEHAAGRRRGERFGPRPLDVDLLLWGDRQMSSPELTLPHPRLRERRFVLEPLAEIAPDLPVPPEGVTVRELLARLPAEPAVERVGWSEAL
ncbi:MAG TPA: 2-amino-4-hydroxy-6-hydroxymethyldihydropteridine diphosphokinase [Thermoanaerobaculia bacterium]|nr:2-amino-4-hydroxy-6-hydroxymethyldihydropteridine diphosphokinase [Thermoanaerobaculia bacterium]